MKKALITLFALAAISTAVAGITKNWVAKRLTIDPVNKKWELHAVGYVGSVKLDRTARMTSAELIPKMTNDPAVVQAVFDEVVMLMLSNAVAEAEAELGQ